MIKITSVTTLACAIAVLAGAAGAADLRVSSPTNPTVRIAVAGKSASQLDTEIKAAANFVCGAEAECVTEAIQDANGQLRYLASLAHRSPAANLQVERGGPTTIRVSLTNKSAATIRAEIQDAAQKVCKAANEPTGDLFVCVDAAVADATQQLRVIAQASSSRQVASN
jgi:hypothetical protein